MLGRPEDRAAFRIVRRLLGGRKSVASPSPTRPTRRTGRPPRRRSRHRRTLGRREARSSSTARTSATRCSSSRRAPPRRASSRSRSRRFPGVVTRPIDPALHAPLNQAAAVVQPQPADRSSATAFIQFVNRPGGPPRHEALRLPPARRVLSGRYSFPLRLSFMVALMATLLDARRRACRSRGSSRGAASRPRVLEARGRCAARAAADGARLLPARPPRPAGAGSGASRGGCGFDGSRSPGTPRSWRPRSIALPLSCAPRARPSSRWTRDLEQAARTLGRSEWQRSSGRSRCRWRETARSRASCSPSRAPAATSAPP